MPRIEADSIQAHVARQNDRILDAAAELFNEQGYRGTDLSQIAASIGLARNSLYRYYPDKDHILLACLEREMTPILTRVDELSRSGEDPRARIHRWLELQLEIAATSCHGAMQMVEDMGRSSPAMARKISGLHEPAARVLREAVDEILRDSDRDAALTTAMIFSMLRSAAAHAMAGGQPEQVKQQLKDAVQRVLS